MITILPDLSEILIYTGEIPITVIIWSLFIGVLIATIAAFVIKVKFGIFIRTLLKLNADSPETAVTLDQTGLKKRFFVRRGLKIHSNYQNLMVAVTDDGRYYANSHYTSEMPVFKAYMHQHGKKGKTVYKNETDTGISEQKPENNASDNADNNTQPLTASDVNNTTLTSTTAHDADPATPAASTVSADNEIIESAMARRLKLEADNQSAQKKDAGVKQDKGTTAEDEDEDEDKNENQKSHDENFQTYINLTQNMPKQRVKFDIDTAKYYIPPELHDRAASLYFSKPTKLIAVIGALILLAVIATFSETIINALSELVDGFIENLKPRDKL